jgi:hypothetical protein
MKKKLDLMEKYKKDARDAPVKKCQENRFRIRIFLVFMKIGNRPTRRVVASIPITRAGSLIAWLSQFISATKLQNRFTNKTN